MQKAVVVNNNPNLKIDSMFAFVANSDEGEGVMAATMMLYGQPTMMPLVGADLDRIKAFLPLAKQISAQSGRPFKVYRFDNKMDITEEIVNEKL